MFENKRTCCGCSDGAPATVHRDIGILGLSAETCDQLKRAGVVCVDDLLEKSSQNLLELEGFTDQRLGEVVGALDACALRLRGDWEIVEALGGTPVRALPGDLEEFARGVCGMAQYEREHVGRDSNWGRSVRTFINVERILPVGASIGAFRVAWDVEPLGGWGVPRILGDGDAKVLEFSNGPVHVTFTQRGEDELAVECWWRNPLMRVVAQPAIIWGDEEPTLFVAPPWLIYGYDTFEEDVQRYMADIDRARQVCDFICTAVDNWFPQFVV